MKRFSVMNAHERWCWNMCTRCYYDHYTERSFIQMLYIWYTQELNRQRSFHSDVETFVVWVVPRNSGENWSTCWGHRETLSFWSRCIFSQSQVTWYIMTYKYLWWFPHPGKYHHVTKEHRDHPFTEIPCRFHSMGVCMKGGKCMFKHEVKKTTVYSMHLLDGDDIQDSFRSRIISYEEFLQR